MPKRQPYNIVGTVGLIPPWKRNANRWATGETMVHLGRPAYCPRPPRTRAKIMAILGPWGYHKEMKAIRKLTLRLVAHYTDDQVQRRAKRGG